MPKDMAHAAADLAGLTWVNDHDPGIRRVIDGRGVNYFDPEGRRIRDAVTLDRIARLAIPPAWTDVWICPDPDGHIQALGRDARRRKQYRYHADWRVRRDGEKFHRVCAFGRALPRLRAQVDADLARHGLPRERVLAAAVRVMERTLIRVGNDEYARSNNSFGLTTLRKRHVRANGGGAVLEFRGKGGIVHRTGFHDRRLARVIHRCEDLRGQRLFQYLDDEGARHAIDSHDVNDYLRAAMGEDFSAKDYRTWAGTLLCARALAMTSRPDAEPERRRAVHAAVKATAALLGNTAKVCRACYVHPAVPEAFELSRLGRGVLASGRRGELALLRLLDAAGACD